MSDHRPHWPLALALAATPLLAHAGARDIRIDGLFGDWAGAPVLHTDPAGDSGVSPVDFRRLWAANDGERLLLRFEVTVEVTLQESNSLVLYVDKDNSGATGLNIGGIGADWRWNFGSRSGQLYTLGGLPSTTFNWLPAEMRQAPTEAAPEFEVAFLRSAVVSGQTLLPGSTVRLLLRNEVSGVQDTLPDASQTVSYTFDPAPVPPPPAIPLGRLDPLHVRLLSHNVEFDTLFDNTPPHGRILQALAPDVILYQEIYDHTAAETRDLVASHLPGTWHAAGNGDCQVISRWPITTTRALDGNIGARIDLPDETYACDLYVVSAHPPCCTNNAGRQAEIDRIMGWVRDLMTAGGLETLPGLTPIVIAGDMNLVGFSQQRRTLLTGDILDNATHGPDFPPDWDGSAQTEAVPIHCAGRDAYTWRSDPSAFAPGRLDFIGYTDSVAALGRHFALWTAAMAPGDLAAAGLQAGDSAAAADHLPFVADLSLTLQPGVPAGLVMFGQGE